MHYLNVKQLIFKNFILLIIFFVFATDISAQQYLEFVENKGQWDNRIQFKGQIIAGSFALKADGGYKMTLLNHDDLAALGNLVTIIKQKQPQVVAVMVAIKNKRLQH